MAPNEALVEGSVQDTIHQPTSTRPVLSEIHLV
jgi:hypothetical protein